MDGDIMLVLSLFAVFQLSQKIFFLYRGLHCRASQHSILFYCALDDDNVPTTNATSTSFLKHFARNLLYFIFLLFYRFRETELWLAAHYLYIRLY
jgi:hypothetical protein